MNAPNRFNSRTTASARARRLTRAVAAITTTLFEPLESRQLMAHSPLTETLPNMPGPNGGLTSVAEGAGGSQSQSLGWSKVTGVRLLDGAVNFTDTDFSTTGFDMPWGQQRGWNSVVGFSNGDRTHNGNGWFSGNQLVGGNGNGNGVGNGSYIEVGFL